MLNTATLLATLALYAAALPANDASPIQPQNPHSEMLARPLQNLFKRATVEHNGQLVECDQTAFLDVYPPSEIELKCREAQGIPPDFVRRDVEINARDTIVEFEGQKINCDEFAFLAVMPPSPLELACRAAGEKQDPAPVGGGWGIARRDVATPVRYLHLGTRQTIEVDGRKVICGAAGTLAVFPPSADEMACRNVGKPPKKPWTPLDSAPGIA